MAKRNAYLDRLQHSKNQYAERYAYFTRQACQDAFMITAHRVGGIGPTRMPLWAAEYTDTLRWILSTVFNGAAEDKENVYAHEVIDRAVREAFGDNLPPYEVRYGLKGVNPNDCIQLTDRQSAYVEKRSAELGKK